MSETRFPPAGTMCSDCDCCEATVYAGNDPICWDCDSGNLCPGRKRAKTAAAREINIPPIWLEPVQPLKTLTQTRADVVAQGLAPVSRSNEATQEKPVNVQRESKAGGRIPEEIRTKIIAEPASMSSREVGEKYGVKEGSVWYIRSKAGVHSTASPGKRYSAHKATPKPERAIEKNHTNGHAAALASMPAASSKVSITVQIDEASADQYWHRLTLDQKAATIELQMQAIVDCRVGARA